MTGIIKASELFPDPDDRKKIKAIVDMFDGKIVAIKDKEEK